MGPFGFRKCGDSWGFRGVLGVLMGFLGFLGFFQFLGILGVLALLGLLGFLGFLGFSGGFLGLRVSAWGFGSLLELFRVQGYGGYVLGGRCYGLETPQKPLSPKP